MKPTRIAIVFTVISLISTGCNTFVSVTTTPMPTATSSPTATFTPEPTITPTQTPIPVTATPTSLVLPVPSGKPLASWEGIPVMPNAIAGEGDSGGYQYIVPGEPDDVEEFYKVEMEKLGWNPLTGGYARKGTTLLVFSNGSITVSISIIPQPEELVHVLIIKF